MEYLDGPELGVFTRTQLRAMGVSRAGIDDALAQRTLLPVRRSLLVEERATREVQAAVRHCGSLTCLSALREYGVWTYPDQSIHLLRAKRARERYPLPPGVTDCRGRRGSHDGRMMVPLATAMSAVIANHEPVHAVVAMDDVLRRGLLPSHELEEVMSACGRRTGTALSLADGRVESALESVVRYYLWRAKIKFRTQVVLPRIGRVDFLIGERLILEVDGFEFHAHVDSFRNDRGRDRSAAGQGYLTIRVTWWDVMHNWPRILDDLRAVLRRRGHRRR